MKNVVIGTAGHIDHGKTSLIKAMTGRDTDRLEEEKKRGITIDLGFTYFDLPNNNKAGIIDVPGHEKFIRNMLAGVVGMDLVLLVIAADEGVMPQTIEHLNILNLLGVKRGIVVLTKCDLVDNYWLELVREDIKRFLQDTFLENAPIVDVSSRTGYGIENLINIIVEQTETSLEERDVKTIPRLPIDRVFSVTGFGTVITGTLISGTLSKGDEVEIYPINKKAIIRNIQIHSSNSQQAFAGQRTAINLPNIKKSDIYRGCVIAPVNSMVNTMLLDVKLNLLKSSRRIVKNGSKLHLYTGTSELLCRVILLDRDELTPGESCYAQLKLEEKLAVRRGDKFIVRFYSPLETIGGGEIIEPVPSKKKRFDKKIIDELRAKEKGSNIEFIEKIIEEKSISVLTVKEVARLTALADDEIYKNINILLEKGKISVFDLKSDKYLWHKSFEKEMKEGIENYLNDYHKKNKYSKGIKKSEIKSKFFPNLKQTVFDLVIAQFEEEGFFRQEGEFLSLSHFRIRYDDYYKEVEQKIIGILNKNKFVKKEELSSKLNYDYLDEIIALMLEKKDLVVINDIITTAEIYNEAKNILIDFINKNSKITVGEYRDLLHLNRNTAILLLEYFDMLKVTKRVGNHRVLL